MRARPLILALAAAAFGLAGCDGADPLFHSVSRAPVIQIVPAVSAPSAPVVTILRTKRVAPPPPEAQPEEFGEPTSAFPATTPGAFPTATPGIPTAPVPLKP